MPLAEKLEEAIPELLIPLFVDDLGLTGKADHAARCLGFLLEHSLVYGYLPNVEKSFYVYKVEDEDLVREAFNSRSLDIQMSRGCDYLGGFVGSAASKHEWLEAKCKMWAQTVETLAQFSVKYS